MLIKAVSVNIDIEYRDICCQNIEYRIEIEKAYRPITIAIAICGISGLASFEDQFSGMSLVDLVTNCVNM
jgi:hypothetical protein